MKIFSLVVALSAFVFSSSVKAVTQRVSEEVYGKMPDGREVRIFTLTNGKGVTARVMEYGAILVSVEVPDRAGKVADVVTGYDTFKEWLGDYAYFGATVGRYGNRIAAGKFSLDGKEYSLATNNKPGGIPSCLHGGIVGFNKKLWTGRQVENGVEFTYVSKDGEEGFPGNLTVKVTYTLDDDNALAWSASATTDAPTVLNIINHAYWNLSDDPSGTVDDHELTIEADQYLPASPGLIPTGELAPVKDTPMDFTRPVKLGERLALDFPALKNAGGYDHAYVLRKGQGVRPAAKLKDTKSGRTLAISTDAPAIQFYLARFDGSTKGKGGATYHARGAACLETQAFPDAPNQPAFPTTVLRPGETYKHTVVWKFSAE